MLVRYAKEIREAFKVYREHYLQTNHYRNIEVIYISGESGTGKTTLAKKICETSNLNYFISSGSNDVLDGYQGQEALILEELRPSSLPMSDLLKLLDNHTNSSIKSRYHNKVLMCNLIIITTVLPIEKFFKNVFQEEQEPIIQLKRRCTTHIKVTKKYIYVSKWDDTIMNYQDSTVFKNNICLEFKKDRTVTLNSRIDVLLAEMEVADLIKDEKTVEDLDNSVTTLSNTDFKNMLFMQEDK